MEFTYNGVSIISLMYFFITSVASHCVLDAYSDNLRIYLNSDYGPLIYNYTHTYSPEFRYPLADTGCIFDSTEPRLHLACPGGYLKFHNEMINTISSATYLTFYQKFVVYPQFIIHGYRTLFTASPENYAICSQRYDAVMKNITEKVQENFQLYEVGYKVNAIDFLTAYKIVSVDSNRNGHWTYSKVISAIEGRPRFYGKHVYRKGLIYQDMSINFTEIYTKEHQMNTIQEQLQNGILEEKYFSGDNYLVAGQLVSTDDLFYNALQRSTLFYENTFPVWRSINEGNWKLVGDVIRKTADESFTDLDVITLYVDGLRINNSRSLHLGGTHSSHETIHIPQILVKVVIDSSFDQSRGLVFHVANDPYISVWSMDEMMFNSPKALCRQLTECSDLYPDFSEVKKGLTYCCFLKDSRVWDELSSINYHFNN